jgi:hypothetical protein
VRRREAEPDEPMTVDEARDRYPGEWVLMRVFEFDEHHHPLRGYVLRHSRSRKAISNRLAKEPPRSELPKHERFYTFHTSLRLVRSVTPGAEPDLDLADALMDLIISEGARSGSWRR